MKTLPSSYLLTLGLLLTLLSNSGCVNPAAAFYSVSDKKLNDLFEQIKTVDNNYAGCSPIRGYTEKLQDDIICYHVLVQCKDGNEYHLRYWDESNEVIAYDNVEPPFVGSYPYVYDKDNPPTGH